jgi:hypothetical protein
LYPCFYFQDCISWSWENLHQSQKSGEIFASSCKILRFFAWFSTRKRYTKKQNICIGPYKSPLFIIVFTFKIAFMDHEKSRIKVKKTAKFLRPGATFCDLWPDSRYAKKIKSIQIYNSNLLNLFFLYSRLRIWPSRKAASKSKKWGNFCVQLQMERKRNSSSQEWS